MDIFIYIFYGFVVLVAVFILIFTSKNMISMQKMKKELLKHAIASLESTEDEIKSESRYIICKYCGRKIDTKKDSFCPGCGATYRTRDFDGK